MRWTGSLNSLPKRLSRRLKVMKARMLAIIGALFALFIGWSQFGAIEVHIRYGSKLRVIREIRQRLNQGGFTNVLVALDSGPERPVCVSGQINRKADLEEIGRIIDEFDSKHKIVRRFNLGVP